MITKEHKEFQERMRSLLAAFAQELPQRINEIESLWSRLQAGWDTKALQEMHRSVHHLVSNGKTFGYPELSVEARALEQTLKRMLVETIAADDVLANRILQQIDADLKQAMRDKDEVTKLTLRSVKTALTEARTSGTEHELSQAEVIAVLQKEAKRRRDTAAEFQRVGDQKRADAELAEMKVLDKYLPRQMDETEIEAVAQSVIAQLGATSPKQMGAVMSATMAEVAGKADGKLVNQVVRRLLGSETK